MVIKTGEVFYKDELDQIWLCESWEDTETHVVHSTQTLQED